VSAPFMQLYVGDYLADTQDLSTEEHGAYFLLLMNMWRHDARLPNDQKKLARIARATPRKWAALWAEIGRFFYVDGDHIRNRRMDIEHQKASAKSEIRRNSGAKGGRAKALKDKEAGLAKATVLPQQGQISDIREDTNVSSPPVSPPKLSKPKIKVMRFDEFWDAYPHRAGKIKKVEARKAYDKAVHGGAAEADILAGVVAFAQTKQAVDGYAEDPHRWLNGRRFDDEHQPAQLTLKAINGGRHGDGNFHNDAGDDIGRSAPRHFGGYGAGNADQGERLRAYASAARNADGF
jgi:uncharacterized protein YdaU (DUF1376 family)